MTEICAIVPYEASLKLASLGFYQSILDEELMFIDVAYSPIDLLKAKSPSSDSQRELQQNKKV